MNDLSVFSSNLWSKSSIQIISCRRLTEVPKIQQRNSLHKLYEKISCAMRTKMILSKGIHWGGSVRLETKYDSVRSLWSFFRPWIPCEGSKASVAQKMLGFMGLSSSPENYFRRERLLPFSLSRKKLHAFTKYSFQKCCSKKNIMIWLKSFLNESLQLHKSYWVPVYINQSIPKSL